MFLLSYNLFNLENSHVLISSDISSIDMNSKNEADMSFLTGKKKRSPSLCFSHENFLLKMYFVSHRFLEKMEKKKFQKNSIISAGWNAAEFIMQSHRNKVKQYRQFKAALIKIKLSKCFVRTEKNFR